MFAEIEETASRQQIVIPALNKLINNPPQSLLIEGGSFSDRMNMASYWACLLNCESDNKPCGKCQPCTQIAEKAFNDFLIIDRFDKELGRMKQDIPVSNIRELLPVWGQPPHGRGSRVTVVEEAQYLNGNSANALLKTLEEPRPGNVFILTAPQRERLLQTLVSRSFVLTLAWPTNETNAPEIDEWLKSLIYFFKTGQGWFQKSSAKGALDKELALQIITGLQREIKDLLIDKNKSFHTKELALIFDLTGLRRLDLILAKAQDSLNANVAPALTLDWVATAALSGKKK